MGRKVRFYEEFINSVFTTLFYEDIHKPIVEPENFQKNIPILKSFENDGNFYSVTLVRQFENASMVHLTVTSKYSDGQDAWHAQGHAAHLELSVQGHECRMVSGGGSMGNETYTFIVTPALPDDKAEYELVFKEHQKPYHKKAGFEITL